jgi:hypothetical protein
MRGVEAMEFLGQVRAPCKSLRRWKICVSVADGVVARGGFCDASAQNVRINLLDQSVSSGLLHPAHAPGED